LGGIGDTFSSLTLIYMFAGAFTLYQVVKSWRSFWAGALTAHNRQLSGGVAFFLLVPIGVLLHEFGHMLAAWSTHSQVLGLHYFVYWGYVEYIPSSNSPLLDWYVALAGNFVSYVLGIVCLAVAATWGSLRPALRFTIMQLGVLELIQTLIFYPLISIADPNFHGDWDSIYSFQAPVASWATLVVHVVSLVGFVLFMRWNKSMRAMMGR
jgi:hypothetical protein